MRWFGCGIGLLLVACVLSLVLGQPATLARAAVASADAPSTDEAAVGQTLTPFTLKDSDGQPWALAERQGKKATVLLFLGTSCPINNAYAPRLRQLTKTYEPKGVVFVGINANAIDSVEAIAAHAREYRLTFPVLRDAEGSVAEACGVRRNPEVVILDKAGVIRYRGRIDDQFGIGYKRPEPLRHDLEEALKDLLAGKEVRVASTPVEGCLIGRPPRPAANATVSYTRDVAPILQRRCQECHRPGEVGPMPLLTYNDAANWAGMIREVVQARRMPPWHADPAVGHFRNERRLSDAELNTLLAWIDQGCPEGDPSQLPPPPNFITGWRIGTPDAVFSMPDKFVVPARARGGVPYQYYLVQTRFDEDRWVTGAEARPGNRAVVHHIIVYVRQRGVRERTDGIGDGFLVAYAPGDLPLQLPPGFGKKIPKGSYMYFQMHYTPNGEEQADLSSVGLVFAKEKPKHEVRTRSIANPRIEIPPGAAAHRVEASTTFRRPAMLLSMSPHMHLRGKSFEYRVVFPDGKKQTLLSVPAYDFEWQTNYQLAKPLFLPAGTRLECTAHFDNSEGNKNNPDPTKTVRWGDQTWEEMMIGFIDYYYVDGPDAGDDTDD
ncbi:MAG TPA: redoxin domain-containing protein [Gemmatales bacterium]|nr:redoxin domain-containing protein [Gemmatales bacterium]